MHDVFVQLIGLIGTALFFLSFQCRDNKNLFRVQLLSYICYTAHLILLGASAGAASYVINIVRSICLGSTWKWAHSRKMCAAICAAQMVSLALTWDGPAGILPVAANIAATLGGYTHSAKKLRLVNMLINSPLWIIYDLFVGSFAGILDEAVSELSMAISIARYGWNNLDQAQERGARVSKTRSDAGM